METLKDKAIALLQNCEIVTLASIDDEGYPRPVPICRLKSEGITSVWMSTGTSSRKTKQFLGNPKAGLSFYKEYDSVVLTGEVTVVTDKATKQALWSEWMRAHFPGGVDDPEYCVLHFKTTEVTYWIEGKFVHSKSVD